jgi:hypothetical protein
VKIFLAIAFLILFAAEASAFTCAQVRWAVKNMSPETLAAYIRTTATPADIAKGRACLKVRQPRHRKRR